MIIDCDRCEVRDIACGDCVVGVLLGAPGSAAAEEVPSGAPAMQLDAPEQRALAVLAEQGLVPRLRLVAPMPRRTAGEARAAARRYDAG